MGHGDAGGDIGVEEELLDGDGVGLELTNELLGVPADLVEPPGQGQARWGGNGPVTQHPGVPAFRLDETEANGGVAGVDAQDPQTVPLPSFKTVPRCRNSSSIYYSKSQLQAQQENTGPLFLRQKGRGRPCGRPRYSVYPRSLAVNQWARRAQTAVFSRAASGKSQASLPV